MVAASVGGVGGWCRIWVVLGGVGEAGKFSLIGVAFEPLCTGTRILSAAY